MIRSARQHLWPAVCWSRSSIGWEGEPAVNGGKSFVDVSTCKWFENAVIWAAQNKIFEGYDEMHFGPEDNISREQIATILWRYAKGNVETLPSRGDSS